MKLGFSAEYVETISPAERAVYKSYYAMEQERENAEENEDAASAAGLDIEDLL